jgi:histone deacetylase 1/2
MKALADSLTIIGQPLRDEEFVSYLLAGLDKDYDALYQVVNSRTTCIPIRDLFSQLMATETRIAARRAETGAAMYYPAAQVAAHGSAYGAGGDPQIAAFGAARGGGGFRPTYRPNFRPPSPPVTKMAPTSAPSGSGNNKKNAPRVVCQLCGVAFHTASKCFKRFNRNFLGIGNDGSNTDHQVAMAMTAQGGGYGGQQSVDPSWYTDSGATHHVTHELNRLTTKKPYYGTDFVHAANGKGMRIHNVGHALLPTPSSKPLHLNRILHVPDSTSNLLSMSKLSRDNNVFIELHPYDLFVKDRDTREPVLRGRCHGGLYEIKAPIIKQALSSVKVSRDMWHSRLGHPASQIVQHVLHSHDLPSSHESNKIRPVCDACQQGKSHQLPFSLSTRVTKSPLEIIYSDVWGLPKLQSVDIVFM